MIGITYTGAVATISVHDCEPLSHHDIAFATRLRDAVRDTADSDDVKAIVIRANGPDFSPPSQHSAPSANSSTSAPAAAGDRGGALSHQWRAAYVAPSGLYQNLAYCKKLIVTAVDGRCTGAGSMLVLCSDFTVCGSESTFESPFGTLPEANLVLAALTVRLNRAKSWMLGGEAWSAARAAHAGLVNRVVPAADVDSAAQRIAQNAARMPLDGVAMTKLLLEAFLDTQGVGQDFDMAEHYAASMTSFRNAAGVAGANATDASGTTT